MLRQGTVNATPQPVDLTGYTATMQFRPYNNDTAPLYYDASSNITLGGIAGTISLTIPASVTGTFTWPSALYDLLLTDSSGNVYPLLTGIVGFNPGGEYMSCPPNVLVETTACNTVTICTPGPQGPTGPQGNPGNAWANRPRSWSARTDRTYRATIACTLGRGQLAPQAQDQQVPQGRLDQRVPLDLPVTVQLGRLGPGQRVRLAHREDGPRPTGARPGD